MESQPQNPEFRNNPENFHPWSSKAMLTYSLIDWYIIKLLPSKNGGQRTWPLFRLILFTVLVRFDVVAAQLGASRL